jgi:hypothetical protein
VLPVAWFIEPPEQHPRSGDKPEADPDEFALTQIDDRPEPHPYCEAKGKPIEQHNPHEYWRYEKHFSYRSKRG